MAQILEEQRANIFRVGAYRQAAAMLRGLKRPIDDIVSQGLLPKIALRRFNTQREKWLPVLHTARGETQYTALFSNTARAHQLKKTTDWVVIYYDGRGGERQCTVTTSAYGPLAGKRIIRGREPERLKYYLHPPPGSVRPGKIQNGFSL